MNTVSGVRVNFAAVTTQLLLLLLLIVSGCRPPQVPILEKVVSVIQYDTAFEEQLKSGQPLRFGLDGMERYVDSLAEPVAVTEWSADHCKWDFFVATNRGCLESTTTDPAASNRVLSQAQYGRCQVILPRNDVGLRMIEEEQRQKNRNVLVSHTEGQRDSSQAPLAQRPVAAQVNAAPISKDSFLAGVSDQVQRSRQKDVLVFVHGFNVSFHEAVAGTAELALKMPFNGAIVSYCWPSQGGVLNYNVDEPINQASVAPFTEFLIALREGVPDARIHILVHSMGNRIVMNSLSQLHNSGASKLFGHVVLCAPDVGIDDFRKWAPGVVQVSEQVTLYANASDSALIASKGLHAEQRAGDAHSPMIVPGIDTIDCSRIESGLLGHSYFSGNDDVASDIFLLIKDHRPASERRHLTPLRTNHGQYWQFSKPAPNLMCTWHFKHLQ